MQSFRTLLIQFYKPYFYYYLFFTGLSLTLLLSKGAIAFVLAFPLKLIGYAGAVFYQHYFYKHEYFYYRNTVMSVRSLYMYSLVPDLIFYLLCSGLSIFLHNTYA